MWPNLQFPADLVTFTEEFLMGNFAFCALQKYLPVSFLKNICLEIFCKLLSKDLEQSLFLVKVSIFWTPLEECVWNMRIVLWDIFF